MAKEIPAILMTTCLKQQLMTKQILQRTGQAITLIKLQGK